MVNSCCSVWRMLRQSARKVGGSVSVVIEHLNDVVAVLSENNLVEVEFVDDNIVKNKGDLTEKEEGIPLWCYVLKQGR